MENDIPKSCLKNWAIKKYHEHRPTMELMSSAKNEYELLIISIVALLEVDPSIRYQGIAEERVQCLKSCHDYLLTQIGDPRVMRERAQQVYQQNVG